jgi:histidine triad (HIT) family protein
MTSIAAQAADCPFCSIVAHRAPAREVFRSDDVVAFLPDVPAVPGHTLVIPRTHVRDIWGLDRKTCSALTEVTRQIASPISEAVESEGVNIIQSNGTAAGQTVFHLHIHIVPRKSGDRMPKLWPEDADWTSAELDSIASTLKSAVDQATPTDHETGESTWDHN